MKSEQREFSDTQVINNMTISGFKSIDTKQSISFYPLTILAGANSSGKSSIIQPLLLLKQTLEAPYDPGPLLLNGPNVNFTKVEQFIPRKSQDSNNWRLEISFGLSKGPILFRFKKGGINQHSLFLDSMTIALPPSYKLYTFQEGQQAIIDHLFYDLTNHAFSQKAENIIFKRHRFFLEGLFQANGTEEYPFPLPIKEVTDSLRKMIHVSGLRGAPRRTYPLMPIGDSFPGTFENYVASIIHQAKGQNNQSLLQQISSDLQELGLTRKIDSAGVDDTQVEIRVGRTLSPDSQNDHDMVSLADVGIGVSQTLPVVVALIVATSGQLVYIEQPEIHLHPRAQHILARLIGRAAKRGVKVIIETHSSILLLGIQELVAKNELPSSEVTLNWFERDPISGLTKIHSGTVDEAGRTGDWPSDFDNVSLDAQLNYLNAAEAKMAKL